MQKRAPERLALPQAVQVNGMRPQSHHHLGAWALAAYQIVFKIFSRRSGLSFVTSETRW